MIANTVFTRSQTKRIANTLTLRELVLHGWIVMRRCTLRVGRVVHLPWKPLMGGLTPFQNVGMCARLSLQLTALRLAHLLAAKKPEAGGSSSVYQHLAALDHM